MNRAATLTAAVLLALVAAGCGSSDRGTADPSPITSPTDQPAAGGPATGAPPAGPAVPPPTGLRDWIYRVPTEIPPGTYVTTVPTDHGHPCYWARLRSFGQPDSVIDEGNPDPGDAAWVVVQPTDVGFKVSNGCTWHLNRKA